MPRRHPPRDCGYRCGDKGLLPPVAKPPPCRHRVCRHRFVEFSTTGTGRYRCRAAPRRATDDGERSVSEPRPACGAARCSGARALDVPPDTVAAGNYRSSCETSKNNHDGILGEEEEVVGLYVLLASAAVRSGACCVRSDVCRVALAAKLGMSRCPFFGRRVAARLGGAPEEVCAWVWRASTNRPYLSIFPVLPHERLMKVKYNDFCSPLPTE